MISVLAVPRSIAISSVMKSKNPILNKRVLVCYKNN
jgi:hypothetical protein